MTTPDPTTILAGIEPLLERYDGFLLDQWGVLHHGQAVLPGVNAALAALRRADKQVAIISNSGRRAAPNRHRMIGLGVDLKASEAVVSSGEVAWQGLKRQSEAPFAALGARCLLFSRDADHSALTGLPLTLVDEAMNADFILLAGMNPDAAYRAYMEAQLTAALERALPMLCTNPDLTSIEKDGLGRGPGSFAQHYAQAGGAVHYIGKPWPAIYRAALTRLGLPPKRIVAIGDSLHHDIKGAAAMGIDGVLITQGIHRDAFCEADPPERLRHTLATLLAEDIPPPRWLMHGFRLAMPP